VSLWVCKTERSDEVKDQPPRRQGRQEKKEKKQEKMENADMLDRLDFSFIFSFFSWRPWRLGGLLFLLLVVSSSCGQESSYTEDLQFVRELRSRGYNDLAREYLDQLAKKAPAALKTELPLERALTEMEAAGDEPDSTKRVALYSQAREQFQAFLRANPSHPRAAEAKFDIARATTLQGKTQLSRALLEDDPTVRTAEGAKARATLVTAFNQLKQLPQSPQTELAMALNLLDQSDTYLNTGNETETRESGQRIQEARKILDKLVQGDPASKITWQARAWVGRCEEMLDNPSKAIQLLNAVTAEAGPAVQDGKRLARYFLILARRKLPKESPDPKATLNNYLIKQAMDWLRDYPNYARTPEGYGIQYWLAKFLLEEAEAPKLDSRTRDSIVGRARRYLGTIERTENEFTDRAKRLKIEAMSKQGTFKKPIDRLLTFEDCYVRAQWEQMQIAEDAKQFKGNRSRAEEERKKRIQNILDSLQSALKKAAAKDSPLEINNARTLLTYYLLEQGKPKDAIAIGEPFALKDRRSSQAASAAIYSLVAYGQLLSKRERDAADPEALKNDTEYHAEKERMLTLARTMVQCWPKERAGDLARHEIALHLLRDENNAEAIEELAAITPAYPSYIRTQFLLARAALQQSAQEKDKGDPKGYKKRALTALRTLPEPDPAADTETNDEYVQGRLLFALEQIKDKQLKEADKVLAALAPKLESLKLDEQPAKAKEKQRKFEDGLAQLSLHSSALQANDDFKAAKYKEVSQRLDKVIDKFNADQLPQLKDSGLGPSVIALDLRANVQLNNMARARAAIKALQALHTEKGAAKGDDETTAILAQLVNLITQQVEELRKKGDKDSLQKAQAGFTAILNEVAGGKNKPTAKLAFLLARCYAAMDEHKKAIDLLQPFAAGGAGADVPYQHAVQLLMVQEYRQLKETDKAHALLDEIIKGKDGKPGWGAKNLDAQKMRILLMEDHEDYVNAARLCDNYVTQLVRRLDDNKLKEYYFEFYYHLVYCVLKHGQRQDNADKKAKAVREAAGRLDALQKRQGGFGSEESKKRFDELLEKEADLREQYNALKGGK
jgi:hypothetical protein